MSSVLIADDHALVRAGCRHYLQTDPEITRVGEAATGIEVLDQLEAERWDLVLLDIHMPQLSGLDALLRISRCHPKVRVLVMSGLPAAQYAANVMRAGARGYISKDGSGDEILAAVRLALSGRRYFSPALGLGVFADATQEWHPALHSRLSAREFQVFCKIAVGSGVSAIASELCLSVKTVSTYRARMLEKLAFGSNAEVTSYALRNSLVQ